MVHFSAADAPWRGLNGLLQRGVWLRATTPAPLGDFLVDQVGLASDYVRRRVETIFLDGMVVDDLEHSIVRDGSTVTLSAALPGLVGATLRRDGFYKSMRAGISWETLGDDGGAAAPAAGLVRVKLFNLILREAGPHVLALGVLVDREIAVECLGQIADNPAEQAGDRVHIVVDDRDVAQEAPG